MTNDPRYPLGKFSFEGNMTEQQKARCLDDIERTPARLRAAVSGLNDQQLDTPYREGGWTVRQLAHHIADSHMTAFHRLRKALTEDWPTVPGYDEKTFATLPDECAPVNWSVEILTGVHGRWVMLLQAMTDEQWKRGFKHGERGPMALDLATLLYAWHSQHHVAHITALRKQKSW